jgi:pimeloyl-ACP methyl ester carboxylesterase
MPDFLSDGVRLAFIDEGRRDGEPVLLIHGFASNVQVNWVGTGWVDLLVKDGRRVIAIDNRGHGSSQGPHDPEDYHARDKMALDVLRLLDHLAIARADVMGYSMGAWISAYLAIDHPERVRSVVFGGLGLAMVTGISGQEKIARALEAARDEDVESAVGKSYRDFAIRTGSDRLALAACMRGSRQAVPEAEIATLAMPVLIAVGTKDIVSGSAEDLAALIPGAEVLLIPNRDHMLAVGDRVFKDGVRAFLSRRP